ncbi:YggS family pyridoxal phosphate-dependent enzyme [Lewinella sp. IMCC34191]|uniref:YggS family pyridoxal phosphate-dependent enzyme n=1 Tax=Lewinella sp. IMCC34191 TaxID=2259172 RepID=UPI000E285C4F|nr:YggS family pyridoxal phosphate-dependent enzyme [Lewinella sp. IMCC34191]
MQNLSDTYNALSRQVASSDARLIAVTKTHPVEKIRELYELGHRDFGENRVSELVEKHEQLPKDINWHFIGHLQRNKVKNVVPIVSLIHSGDSLRLLRELDKRSDDSRTDVLLQYHIADEESKYGLTRESGQQLLASIQEDPLQHVRIVGVMGMATYTDDAEQVAGEFRTLHEIFSDLKTNHFQYDPAFTEISMGMSGDYEIALQQGSTLVRIGSKLFGERPTN